MTNTYKPIKRRYHDGETFHEEKGIFIARGIMADGHLAYSRLNENNEIIEDEECAYIQCRAYDGLYMERI